MAKQIIAFLLGACGLVFVGFMWGQTSAADGYRADQDKARAAANALYQAEVDRGRAAARDYAATYGQLQTTFKTLEGKFDELRTRVPLVVYRPAVVRPVAGAAAQPAPGPADPAHAGAPIDVGAPPDLGLSLGAVWMWNSALAGADVPAGACGAADTATEACAADAGLGLADAWANHQTNAQTCAEDRLRYQHLIDYLSRK